MQIKRITALFFALLTVLTLPCFTYAAFDSADNSFTAEKEARQESRTEGDFVALGTDAEVSKGVGGDVYMAGFNVTVTDGEEVQNIAALGANVNIRVKKARNIYAAGADLSVKAEEEAQGAYLSGLSVSLTGTVRDAHIMGGSVNIDGSVKEHLQIRSDNIVFGEGATVGGDITIYSKKQPHLPSSIDASKVTYKSSALFGGGRDEAEQQSRLRRIGVILAVSGVVAAMVVSLVVNALRGGFFKAKAQGMHRRFWLDLLYGLAAFVVAPVVAIILMTTIVGLPVGLLLLGLYAVALYLAPVAAGVTLGRVVFRRMNRFASGAICVGLLWALMHLPYVGFIICAAAVLYGLGAMVTGLRRRDDDFQLTMNN